MIPSKRRRSKLSLKIESQKKENSDLDNYSTDAKTSNINQKKNEEEIFESDDEDEDILSSDSFCEINNDMNKEIKKETKKKQFIVNFYLYTNKTEQIFPIESDFFDLDNQTVSDLIENITKKINEEKIVIEIKSRQYDLILKENNEKNNFYIENYEIRQCEDGFKPDYKLESYSPELKLKNIINQNICFTSKNNMNILLREKINEDEDIDYVKENKHAHRSGCLIM